MGKGNNKYGRGRGGKGRGGNRGGGSRGNDWRDERGTYTEIVRENKKFEDYYNNLAIVDEDEQDAFWTAMRTDLPNSFRFTGSRGHALTVQKSLIDRYIPQIVSVEYEGQKVAPPEQVPWYPSKLAWQMTTPKNVIRRFPPFAAFQKFLVAENTTGNITRQEIVSMLPPLFMDIKPGMTVLDLCAAPGSKSAQLIEMVHGGEEARVRKVLEQVARQDGKSLGPSGMEVDAERDLAETEADYEDNGRSTGLLIANDKEYRRAQMLVHQTKRLSSANVIVTNHDATVFPSLRIPSPGPQQRYLKFDRILADVPCSGDGTTRKNYDVWKHWTVGNGMGLHSTQVRILCRALQMLKVGGRVVYSTCSLNPIENESVVAEAMDLCGGSDNVEIVSTADMLPELKRREGMRSWTVTDREGRVWNSWEEVLEARKEGQKGEALERLSKGFFPPPAEDEVPLHRCIRVYPHLQDTGGFFVCVLQKKSEIKLKQEPSKAAAPSKEPTAEEAPISAAVAEIQSQTAKDVKEIAHVPAADGIADGSEDIANEDGPQQELDTETSDEPASKRLKTRESPDTTAADKAHDRKVHFPPPPSNPPNSHPVTNGSAALSADVGFAPGKRKRTDAPQEEAFKYLAPDHEELLSTYKFYDLSSRFPRDRFLVRNASGIPAKAIYYTCALARDILTHNEGKGIKFVHAGVRMFVKQDTSRDPDICKWRIQNEGLPIIEPWVGDARSVTLYDKEVLRRLLIEMFPRCSAVDDGDEETRTLGDLVPQVRARGIGCCVLRVLPDPANPAGSLAESLAVPLWRGAGSVNLMLPKEERRAMLLRLFDDGTPLVDTHKRRQEQRRADADGDGDAGDANESDNGLEGADE